MKKERLTLEELESLKPTPYSMVELECDDGHYAHQRKKIKVFAVVDYRIYFINIIGKKDSADATYLTHYPSFKPGREKVQLFECLDEMGSVAYLTDDNKFFGVHSKQFHPLDNIRKIPNGKSIWIYTDNGEIVQEEAK